MYRSSPFHSTLKHGLHYNFRHVWSMYRSSPFRSTLNTGYITTLDMCEVCTEAVHSVALWTRVTLQLWTCVKYVPKQSTPYMNTGYITTLDMCEVCTEAVHVRSTLNSGYITTLDMCEVCTEAGPFRSALNTGYITTLYMCEVCTEAIHSVYEHGLHYNFGHVWSMYRSSPFHSTLNSGYITTLDMCEVCTEAVHSAALWTRVTVQLWTCVKYVSHLWILVECGTQSEVV